MRSSNLSWIIFAIYASPRIVECSCLWSNLSVVAKLYKLSWVMLGDFNEVLSSNDKFGGNPICISQALRFKECLDDCGMMDLGFCGLRYTWSNLRDITDLILERLDRCFSNVAWQVLYPKAIVQHLTRIHSDHSPIMLSLVQDQNLGL